jgi:hypothetical protein
MGNNPWYYLHKGSLVKEKKPCMPGDQVHLHSMEGCYSVWYVYATNFVVKKKGKLVDVKWEDYRCHRGQGTSEEAFIKKVARQVLQQQAELANTLNTLLVSIKK